MLKVKELLEINLTKHVQVLDPENYKTLLAEVKNEDLSKCHHGLEVIVKMSIFPRLSVDLIQSQPRLHEDFK